MFEWVPNALKWFLSQPPRISAVLALGTAFILFVPDEWVSALNFKPLRETYSAHVSVVFVLAIASLVTHISFALGPKAATWVQRKRRRFELERDFQKTFAALKPSERAIPAWCASNYTKEFYAPKHAPIIQRMIDRGFVESAGKGNDLVWPFKVNDALWYGANNHRAMIRKPPKPENRDFAQNINTLDDCRKKFLKMGSYY